MPTPQNLSAYDADYLLLLEGGFVAINQADGVAADQLFDACLLLRPENSLGHIGKGYVALNRLQMKNASQIFEAIVHREPKNEMARGLLSLTYAFVPVTQKKSRQLAQELKSSTKDNQAKTLADSILALLNHLETDQSKQADLGAAGIRARAERAKAKKEAAAKPVAKVAAKAPAKPAAKVATLAEAKRRTAKKPVKAAPKAVAKPAPAPAVKAKVTATPTKAPAVRKGGAIKVAKVQVKKATPTAIKTTTAVKKPAVKPTLLKKPAPQKKK
jgi:hypothetical protein